MPSLNGVSNDSARGHGKRWFMYHSIRRERVIQSQNLSVACGTAGIMSRHEPHLNRAMTIAFVHTDFRLYWKSRLEAFNEFCNARGDRLVIVEVAGKGSPYSFAGTSA